MKIKSKYREETLAANENLKYRAGGVSMKSGVGDRKWLGGAIVWRRPAKASNENGGIWLKISQPRNNIYNGGFNISRSEMKERQQPKWRRSAARQP